MRRGAVLGALTLVVCGLWGLWAFLRQPGEEAAAEIPQAQSRYCLLYERPLSDFQGMTVQLADGSAFAVVSDMVFDAGGSLLGVRSSLAQPLLVVGQEDFALSSLSYQMMLLTAQKLPYTASYEGLDREDCGLNSPSARITVTYRTGTPIELTIGRLTASGLSCYVALTGDERVYLVPYDFHEVMTQPLSAHHQLPGALSASPDSAQQIAQMTADQTMWLASRTGDQPLPWQVEKPFCHGGSSERITAFIEGVCAIHAEAYEATVRDAEGLKPYGLYTPQRLVVAFSNAGIRDIHVGKDAGNGQVYVRMDQSGDVYRISRNQLGFLDQAGEDGMLDRFVALIPSGDVSAATLTWEDKSYTLTRTQQDGSAAYAMNGHELSAQAYAALYRALAGLSFDKPVSASAPDDEPLARITYQRTNGDVERVTFYAWDAYYVFVETEGGGRFLVRRTRLDEMLQPFQMEEKL
ncbi:MAG: DUF4340 domain-containing protein [Aristaeellaceae bacterium]